MRLIILGSGTSLGVPQIGCGCATCTSSDPRDRRTRVSAVIEESGRRVLIDSPPEIRLQLVANSIDSVDAVLYTHDHADHVHGIDDLRAISFRSGTLPLYGEQDVLDRIKQRFDYIFDKGTVVPRGTFKPELKPVPITPGTAFQVAGFRVLPVPADHGVMPVLGYRFGEVAYLTDVKTLSESSISMLDGVRVLVVNALFEKPHPTHLSFPEAIDLARSIGAERTIFTHLTHASTHSQLEDRLPPGFEPAHDGLTVELY